MRELVNAVVTTALYDEQKLLTFGGVYENGVLEDSCLRPNAAWKSADPKDLPQVEILVKLDSALYCGRFFAHLGHFLTETLPMFYWAHEFGGPLLWHPWPAHLAPVVARTGFVSFFLQALNVAESRLVFAGPAVTVANLTVPPQARILVGESSGHLRGFYSRLAEHGQKIADAPQRIYFSRSKFKGQARLIDNEPDAEEVFRKHGFEIVYPETLPIDVQVGLARGAKIIAGIDGSALHLCAFMNEGGRCFVLESRKVRAIYAMNESAGVETIALKVCRWETENAIRKIVVDTRQLEIELQTLS